MASEPDKVAFFGLGIMGGPMAANLARAGLDVSVWTHTQGKAERFAAEHDVRAGATPAETAAGADALISILPDGPEVEAVLFGNAGAAAALAPGALVVDMSTIAPSASVQIAERLEREGFDFLEAPVSGSRPKAEDGTLTIMAGGPEAAFRRAEPLFDVLGERIVHVGPQGHGQLAKLLTNVMGAVNAAALAEAVVTVRGAGIDPDAFLEVAAGSAGNSAMVTLKGPPMFEERFEPPLFKLEHMLKDIRHAIAEAKALGVELRLGALAETLYAKAAEEGHGEEDFAAVLRAVE
jgi:3-hydroxyisobutyrate dehydrogenase-like beta-hydroxyacid dehydrogenase